MGMAKINFLTTEDRNHFWPYTFVLSDVFFYSVKNVQYYWLLYLQLRYHTTKAIPQVAKHCVYTEAITMYELHDEINRFLRSLINVRYQNWQIRWIFTLILVRGFTFDKLFTSILELFSYKASCGPWFQRSHKCDLWKLVLWWIFNVFARFCCLKFLQDLRDMVIFSWACSCYHNFSIFDQMSKNFWTQWSSLNWQINHE